MLQKLVCPKCNKRIIDAVEGVMVFLREYDENIKINTPDLIQKCPHCGVQVAINIMK